MALLQYRVMLPSHANELAAAVAAALQRLDDYESAVGEVLERPEDELLYARSVEQFDAIRALTASIPGLQVRWIEVLISRFELLEELWQVKDGKPRAPDLDRLRDNHTASVQSFRRLCLRRVTSGGATASR
jgi:hypothetical protein